LTAFEGRLYVFGGWSGTDYLNSVFEYSPDQDAWQVKSPMATARGFADRRTGVGLYAFVEADQAALEAQLRNELAAARGPKPPEHIQVVPALPRDGAGKLRTEILQLVAMNQLDLIEPMMTSETDRAFVKSIVESRKNLRDRFNFETPVPPPSTDVVTREGG